MQETTWSHLVSRTATPDVVEIKHNNLFEEDITNQSVFYWTDEKNETSAHAVFFPGWVLQMLSKWFTDASQRLHTVYSFPPSFPLSSPSEHSTDLPRISFSVSSGLWLFSSSLRLKPVWPDRGRFQTGPDSDETTPGESRSWSQTHSGESVDWDHESMCVSLCLSGSNFLKVKQRTETHSKSDTLNLY